MTRARFPFGCGMFAQTCRCVCFPGEQGVNQDPGEVDSKLRNIPETLILKEGKQSGSASTVPSRGSLWALLGQEFKSRGELVPAIPSSQLTGGGEV